MDGAPLLLRRLELEMGRAAGAEAYLRVGRWYVRHDHVLRFIRVHGVSVRDLPGFRVRFIASAKSPAPDLVLVRGAPRPKLSSFVIAQGHRRTAVLHQTDFNTELAALAHFAGLGVSVPRILHSEDVGQTYVQELVANPLSGAQASSPEDVLTVLAEIVGRTDWQSRPIFECIDEASLALESLAPVLKEESCRHIGRMVRDLGRIGPESVPYGLCHGDLSTGNVIVGEDGRTYLIDFDRSFNASAFFDAVYFGLSTRRGYEMPVARVRDVMANPLVDAWAPHAARLFMMDVVRFAGGRAVRMDQEDDRYCAYSLYLIEQALRHAGAGARPR